MRYKESWRPVDHFDNYLVSTEGRVQNRTTGRILRDANANGYRYVRLYNETGSECKKVHRLVAQAFLGDIPFGYDVAHIDNDKTNNQVNNLEIITHGDNTRNAHRDGLCLSHRVEVVETGEIYPSLNSCAKAIGGRQGAISNVLNGRARRHLGYTFRYVN